MWMQFGTASTVWQYVWTIMHANGKIESPAMNLFLDAGLLQELALQTGTPYLSALGKKQNKTKIQTLGTGIIIMYLYLHHTEPTLPLTHTKYLSKPSIILVIYFTREVCNVYIVAEKNKIGIGCKFHLFGHRPQLSVVRAMMKIFEFLKCNNSICFLQKW